MDSVTEDLLKVVKSQLPAREAGDGSTKYGKWYGKNVESDTDYSAQPWCNMFLSWAATEAGVEDATGQFAWTVKNAEFFKDKDAWTNKPEPGAFVFYDWDGSESVDAIDHVGIVERVEGDTIHTIEGNIDGGVLKRKERDQSKVVGYGLPDEVREKNEVAAAEKSKEKVEENRDEPLAKSPEEVMPDKSASTPKAPEAADAANASDTSNAAASDTSDAAANTIIPAKLVSVNTSALAPTGSDELPSAATAGGMSALIGLALCAALFRRRVALGVPAGRHRQSYLRASTPRILAPRGRHHRV